MAGEACWSDQLGPIVQVRHPVTLRHLLRYILRGVCGHMIPRYWRRPACSHRRHVEGHIGVGLVAPLPPAAVRCGRCRPTRALRYCPHVWTPVPVLPRPIRVARPWRRPPTERRLIVHQIVPHLAVLAVHRPFHVRRPETGSRGRRSGPTTHRRVVAQRPARLVRAPIRAVRRSWGDPSRERHRVLQTNLVAARLPHHRVLSRAPQTVRCRRQWTRPPSTVGLGYGARRRPQTGTVRPQTGIPRLPRHLVQGRPKRLRGDSQPVLQRQLQVDAGQDGGTTPARGAARHQTRLPRLPRRKAGKDNSQSIRVGHLANLFGGGRGPTLKRLRKSGIGCRGGGHLVSHPLWNGYRRHRAGCARRLSGYGWSGQQRARFHCNTRPLHYPLHSLFQAVKSPRPNGTIHAVTDDADVVVGVSAASGDPIN